MMEKLNDYFCNKIGTIATVISAAAAVMSVYLSLKSNHSVSRDIEVLEQKNVQNEILSNKQADLEAKLKSLNESISKVNLIKKQKETQQIELTKSVTSQERRGGTQEKNADTYRYQKFGKYYFSTHKVTTRTEARTFCEKISQNSVNSVDLRKAAVNHISDNLKFVSSIIENGEVKAWEYNPSIRRVRKIRSEQLVGRAVCIN
mgnify:CR=1 FL=1